MGGAGRRSVAWGSAVPKIFRARLPHDDGEDRKVRRLAGARHAPAGWIERARIVALSWDGLGVPAIAEQAGCHPPKVRRWLPRFSAGGADGLGDRPGAGRKRRITEAERAAVIALARPVPPGRLARGGAGELPAEAEDGPAEWTLDALTREARAAGIEVGRSQVRRILRAEKVRWHRIKAPLGYARGPEKTWVDGGLRISGGQEITMCAPSRNSGQYQRFLQQAEDASPRGQIVLITGNLSSHDSKATRAWLERHPRIRHAFIPKGACWLNLQEGWWRIFRTTALAGQDFADPDEIAYATRLATAQHNARARLPAGPPHHRPRSRRAHRSSPPASRSLTPHPCQTQQTNLENSRQTPKS